MTDRVEASRPLRGDQYETLSHQVTTAVKEGKFHGPEGALATERKRLGLARKFQSRSDARFALATAWGRAALTFYLASEEARRLSREKGRRLREKVSWRFHAEITRLEARIYHRRMNRAARRQDLPSDQRAICAQVNRRIRPPTKNR